MRMAVVLISGCRTGIGLATALAFARRGDTVYAGIRDHSRSDALQAAARTVGATISVIELDVTDAGSVSDAVAAVVSSAGRVDVLVNNAGIGYAGPVEEMDAGLARAVFETNFWGPVRLIREVLPHMRGHGGGVIVNISSFTTQIPALPVVSMYTASKAALSAMTESLRWEVAAQNVRVLAIEPGLFSTGFYHAGQTRVADRSPYFRLVERVDQMLADGVTNGADPGQLAEAIVEAVADPATPTRLVVGEDAIKQIDAFRAMEPASWDRAMARRFERDAR